MFQDIHALQAKDNLTSITHENEFMDFIRDHERVICFVHSPWSATSVIGLEMFHRSAEGRGEAAFAIIDNESGERFIYGWLKNQEQLFPKNRSQLEERSGSWIHGHGEMFGVIHQRLVWFEKALYLKTLSEIEERFCENGYRSKKEQ